VCAGSVGRTGEDNKKGRIRDAPFMRGNRRYCQWKATPNAGPFSVSFSIGEPDLNL
jgi:hypothetical protein